MRYFCNETPKYVFFTVGLTSCWKTKIEAQLGQIRLRNINSFKRSKALDLLLTLTNLTPVDLSVFPQVDYKNVATDKLPIP